MLKNKLIGLGLFAAGAGLGAAVGLLYAPRAGKHTRRRLRDSASRTVGEIADVRDDIRGLMSEWVDETSEIVASSIASGGEGLKETGASLVQTMSKVRERMEQGRGRVEEYIRSVAS